MSPQTRRQLRQEVDLIGRFAESYRKKFAEMIERMNHHSDTAVDLASLRLCVEAVDMMLANQTELVRVLQQLTEASEPRLRAA